MLFKPTKELKETQTYFQQLKRNQKINTGKWGKRDELRNADIMQYLKQILAQN